MNQDARPDKCPVDTWCGVRAASAAPAAGRAALRLSIVAPPRRARYNVLTLLLHTAVDVAAHDRWVQESAWPQGQYHGQDIFLGDPPHESQAREQRAARQGVD